MHELSTAHRPTKGHHRLEKWICIVMARINSYKHQGKTAHHSLLENGKANYRSVEGGRRRVRSNVHVKRRRKFRNYLKSEAELELQKSFFDSTVGFNLLRPCPPYPLNSSARARSFKGWCNILYRCEWWETFLSSASEECFRLFVDNLIPKLYNYLILSPHLTLSYLRIEHDKANILLCCRLLWLWRLAKVSIERWAFCPKLAYVYVVRSFKTKTKFIHSLSLCGRLHSCHSPSWRVVRVVLVLSAMCLRRGEVPDRRPENIGFSDSATPSLYIALSLSLSVPLFPTYYWHVFCVVRFLVFIGLQSVAYRCFHDVHYHILL